MHVLDVPVQRRHDAAEADDLGPGADDGDDFHQRLLRGRREGIRIGPIGVEDLARPKKRDHFRRRRRW